MEYGVIETLSMKNYSIKLCCFIIIILITSYRFALDFLTWCIRPYCQHTSEKYVSLYICSAQLGLGKFSVWGSYKKAYFIQQVLLVIISHWFFLVSLVGQKPLSVKFSKLNGPVSKRSDWQCVRSHTCMHTHAHTHNSHPRGK